ncbi:MULTISPECIES: hypothetical protein [Pseudomonas]|uniref:hypothetical protein n=1 Tax=Pseudomonas TaxID=286 RepID=UPI000FDD031D|nr:MULTISPECIES: hypothetical protein [Pseudomonas]AZZ76067.1 hypothetical protein CCX46_13140 [Pseudomonas sp. RU47]QHF50641.1 hypothetical protein PspS49_13695 [Pseudomonas sp. S49]WNZ86862.1 hypothetical protein QOM10_13190 [Pseudomonas sp. P108]
MFSRYPEQKQSRKVLCSLGAAILALGVFLIAIEGVGGVLFTVMGGGLMLACFTGERTFARILRLLSWF